MLRKLCLTLCAVALVGFSVQLRAQDAPAPAPKVTPETDTKPAAPAEADKSKPEKSAKDEKAGSAQALDPTVVQGTPPTFPLKSDNFADIEDGYDSSTDAGNIEVRVLEDLFTAVRASSQQYLEKNVNPKITYVTMMNHPETCRGEVVKMMGTLRFLTEIDRTSKPPLAGVTKYWRGQISVGSGKITSFISMEPLPKDAQVGRAIHLVGIFMKRWVYTNNAPGNQGTWTPLIVCRRVERVTDYDNVATGAMNSWLGIGIFAFVGGGLLLYFIARGSKSRYDNKFSRMKSERGNNTGRNFPRPG